MREYYIILFPFGTENETMLSEVLFISIVSATSTCSYFIALITTGIQYLVPTTAFHTAVIVTQVWSGQMGQIGQICLADPKKKTKFQRKLFAVEDTKGTSLAYPAQILGHQSNDSTLTKR